MITVEKLANNDIEIRVSPQRIITVSQPIEATRVASALNSYNAVMIGRANVESVFGDAVLMRDKFNHFFLRIRRSAKKGDYAQSISIDSPEEAKAICKAIWEANL